MGTVTATRVAFGVMAGLALAGCQAAGPAAVDPGALDPAGLARAETSPPELVTVAEGMQAQAGAPMGAGLTLEGARAEGDVLIIETRSEEAAASYSPEGRAAYAATHERDFQQTLCGQPALRALIEQRGGVRSVVRSQDGETLVDRTFADCA